MGKSKDKIRVKFCGYNSENVTGSQTLIECGESKEKVLVECGLIQDNVSLLKQYQLNSAKFAFKPKELKYVFVGHNHADYCAMIPRLYKEGCTAQIIVPEGFKALYKEMCLDSANIMARDSEDLSKRLKKDYFPIYTPEDVYNSMNYIRECKVEEKIKMDDNIEVQFLPSGHIFGACQVILWIKNGNSTKKLGFTSDLGNISLPQYYIDEFKPIQSANLLVGETTYSDKKRSVNKKDRDKDLEKLESVIENTCVDAHGSILIPVFALHRLQSMITFLYDIFSKKENFDIPIYVGTPLGTRITKVIENELKGENKEKLNTVLAWKNIHFCKDFEELQGLLKKDEPAIYCCSSGMMNAGYSVYVASQLLPHAKNNIVFCGYSAEGTLAWKIKQKKTKTITIDGRPVPSRCGVINLTSMSSHMQHDDLLHYYSQYNYDKVALVHGNFKDKCVFAKELENEISKKNRTGKVVSVNKSTEILL